MGNAGFVEHVAAADEIVARVERHRIELRVEQDARVPARSRFIDQPQQKRAAHATPAPFGEHRHAADVRIRQQPRAANRLTARASCKRVQRRLVGVVPLERFGYALLDDEHRATDDAQLALRVAPLARLHAEIRAHR